MDQLLWETRYLHLMKHPNIDEISAVFFNQEDDTSNNSTMAPEGALSSFDVSSGSINGPAQVVSAFIKMPFYEGSTLDDWLKCNRELLMLEKLKMLSC